MIVAVNGADMFLFYSRFDEAADRHTGHYQVWSMPPLSDAQLQGSWIGLEDMALARLPDIGLDALPFAVPGRGQMA